MNRDFMRVTALAALILACVNGHLLAQGKPPAPIPPPVTVPLPVAVQDDKANWDYRIFQVRYADLDALVSVFRIFRADIVPEERLRVLSVRAPKEILPAIEDAIKRLDVPPAPLKQVELTVYVMKATDAPTAVALPPVLQPVVNQLRNVFSYKGYELSDTLVVRGADGRMSTTSGILPGLNRFSERGTTYSFATRFRVQPADPKPRVVLLEDMLFSIDVEVDANRNRRSFQISNNVDVPFGQQVVVGKTNAGDATAIILVITSKLIE